ncbi:hypothetical protein HPS54_10160 [Prevotella sp. PCHR]|uniref:Uncharacterized protein n=1 Tax=Xylanibacter caecicola TaxID=2736294 RepID=A0ABX2B6N0_9BACT|nr:hypothetical protein [Xylanibacter caecicola]NPE25875.1 hypothetical protein [Xylanibacter caecicola]
MKKLFIFLSVMLLLAVSVTVNATNKVAYGEGELTAIPSDPANTYYFCISEMGENGEPARFKMSPSRVRNGGDVLGNLFSFNIQDFLLQTDADGYIHYWIENGDKSVSYRPHGDNNDNYELGTKEPTDEKYAGKNTKYEAYGKSKTTAASEHKFKLKKSTGMSYTWLLNTENKLEIIINKEYFGGELDEGGYYLVGNLTNAKATEDIDPTNSQHRQFMKKYWFKNGFAYTTETENADSIVYRATVTRPKNGWGQLYLAVFSKTGIDNFNKGNMTASWDAAIRPEEQWAYSHDGDAYNGVDATALHGGLFTKGMARSNQALNPVVSDDIESYTFSMNATTSTYRIAFNHSLYIMGPAVGNSDDSDAEGWSSANPDKQTKHAYKLVYDADESCYKYIGTDGNEETPVPLTAGKQFAFVYNKNFKNTFFEEDIVVPVDLSGTTEEKKESNNYNINPKDSYGNKDTQYVNFLRTAANQSNAEYNEENVNACTFNLPTGEYFIRLYIRQSPNDPDLTKIYYVIRDRKYNFYCPNADAEKIGGYTTFRAFCDYHAVIVPEGIDVFTIGNANKAERTVTMKSYDLGDERVLPAEMPVILARKDRGDGERTQAVTMEYYKEPNQKQNKANGDNLLNGQISRTEIPVTTEDNRSNFIFGYKRLNTSDPYVTIGFFVPGAGKCSINSAYITLDKDFLDGSTTAKAFRLVFDGSETTDINGIDAETESQVENNSYYTLQGIKTAGRPTAKGIYVFNDRKVVIK